MSKRKHRKGSSRERPANPGRRRAFLVAITVVPAVGIFAAVLFLRGERDGTILPRASPPARAASPAATVVAPGSGFQALNGRWLRPDGGYVLEIRGVDAGGPPPRKACGVVVTQGHGPNGPTTASPPSAGSTAASTRPRNAAGSTPVPFRIYDSRGISTRSRLKATACVRSARGNV